MEHDPKNINSTTKNNKAQDFIYSVPDDIETFSENDRKEVWQKRAACIIANLNIDQSKSKTPRKATISELGLSQECTTFANDPFMNFGA